MDQIGAQNDAIAALQDDVTALQTAQAETDAKVAAIEGTVTMLTVQVADQVCAFVGSTSAVNREGIQFKRLEQNVQALV